MKNKVLAISLLAPVLAFAMAFSVFAQSATPTATTTPVRKQVDTACVKAAVVKRESAIQTAFSAYSSSINGALSTRASELSAAWDITDARQRRAAIVVAWAKYRTSRMSANKILRQARLAIWKQFTADRKACGSGPTGEDMGIDLVL